ncbi:MAG TPA: class I SAM-dependent methyltransferase [Jatrophihabitantaceae bacterium]
MSPVTGELAGRWNHNTHYYPLALAATPCNRALDVGCGDGLLLRLLAARCDEVVGVDPWGEAAQEAARDLPNVTVLPTDFLAAQLPDASFDLVSSNTAIHHMDFAAALARMAALLRPGGRLVVVSIGDYGNRLDRTLSALAIVPHRWRSWRNGFYDHPAPIADTDMSYGEIRRTAKRIVPGVTYRRRLYWRYSLTWTRPG